MLKGEAMTETSRKTWSSEARTPRRPGFLLAPFGWVAEPLAAMAQAEPALLAHLFEMGRPRMHAIALAFAHYEGEPTPQFGLFLARASAREIVDRAFGRRPPGIARALQRLPGEVLKREHYRDLIQLLDEPETAKVLHHAGEIDGPTIRVLCRIPVPLRRIVMMTMEGWFERVEVLPDALRFFVARGAASSFEALVADLATANQPGQLAAKMNDLVEALPLPDSMPPAQVGRARRLDRTAEIRKLARNWKNCLANYGEQVDSGGYAIYLWEEREAPAACLVQRHGRLGWFVEDVKGPRNAEIEPERLDVIHKAFADARIPRDDITDAIKALCDAETFPRAYARRRAGRRRQAEEVGGDEGCARIDSPPD
jgi:hypothetical protein